MNETSSVVRLGHPAVQRFARRRAAFLILAVECEAKAFWPACRNSSSLTAAIGSFRMAMPGCTKRRTS
jgi:hypothetical protein